MYVLPSRRRIARVVFCCGLLFLISCSASQRGSLRSAFRTAAVDPWTWAPLAGAGAVAAVDADRRISDWAKSSTPIYGSNQAALDASDSYRALASTSAWATFLVANSRGEEQWLTEKSIDAGGNLTGLATARNVTGLLKQAAQRPRPHDGPVHDSFPSAHSTDAFAHASFGRLYADDLPLSSTLRNTWSLGMSSFAVATAWGRVEGGVHYPTDVLMGSAIANFTTRFFLELTDPAHRSNWRINPATGPDGGVIIEIEAPF